MREANGARAGERVGGGLVGRAGLSERAGLPSRTPRRAPRHAVGRPNSADERCSAGDERVVAGRRMGVLAGAFTAKAAGRPIREHISIKKTGGDI